MEEFLFGVIGGTALLMYGVDKMGKGLEKASGNTMKRVLKVLTGNVVSAFLVGILITAIIQSSTAVTVLTVGFVNSGLMQLPQAVGIIYGANIGTTVLAQLMAFSFKFNLTDIALPILGVGFFIARIAKNKNLKNIGDAIMGFGMMFLGLKILNSGVPYMQESEKMSYFFATYASNPIIGILLGAFATAMVHSSAATVGLIMVLSQAGLLDLQSAIYLMLGNNLGTCITAQLASMSGNINARRTAWAHTLYNAFGVVLALVFLPIFMKIVIWFSQKMHDNPDISVYIANSHTLFNSINALIFLPLTKYYVKLLEKLISPKGVTKQDHHLDELLLETPVIAITMAKKEIARGTTIVKEMLKLTTDMIYEQNLNNMGLILDKEAEVNTIQKEVTRYLLLVSDKQLNDKESKMIPELISSVNHIERAGDRVCTIVDIVEKLVNGDLELSKFAMEEIWNIENVIFDMFDICENALLDNFDNVLEIGELEEKVDTLSEAYQNTYTERINDKICVVDSAVLFIDILGHMERIADHIYKTTKYALK